MVAFKNVWFPVIRFVVENVGTGFILNVIRRHRAAVLQDKSDISV